MPNNTLINRSKKDPPIVFTPKSTNFNALLVVYKIAEGCWKGFIHPYGETTEATFKEEAIKKLRDLADAYYETIKRYNFPAHLVNPHLEDVTDRDVFSRVVRNESFMKKVYSEPGKADSEHCYAEAYRNKS